MRLQQQLPSRFKMQVPFSNKMAFQTLVTDAIPQPQKVKTSLKKSCSKYKDWLISERWISCSERRPLPTTSCTWQAVEGLEGQRVLLQIDCSTNQRENALSLRAQV